MIADRGYICARKMPAGTPALLYCSHVASVWEDRVFRNHMNSGLQRGYEIKTGDSRIWGYFGLPVMFCVCGVLGGQRNLDVRALLQAYIIAMFVGQGVFDA